MGICNPRPCKTSSPGTSLCELDAGRPDDEVLGLEDLGLPDNDCELAKTRTGLETLAQCGRCSERCRGASKQGSIMSTVGDAT